MSPAGSPLLGVAVQNSCPFGTEQRDLGRGYAPEEGLHRSCQGAAAHPDSEEQQQRLREAAEGLRMATNAAAQNAIKKKLVHRLEVGLRGGGFREGGRAPASGAFSPAGLGSGLEGGSPILLFLSSTQPNKLLQLPPR